MDDLLFIPVAFAVFSLLAYLLHASYRWISQFYFKYPLLYGPFSIIGVAVHELSHLLLVLAFGHKVVEVKFVDTDSFLTGHVRHRFDSKNIWSLIGVMYISMAPMLIMGFFVFIIVREVFGVNFNVFEVQSVFQIYEVSASISAFTGELYRFLTNALIAFTEGDILRILTFLLVGTLAVFSAPSKADFEGYFQSLIINLGLLLGILLVFRWVYYEFYTILLRGVFTVFNTTLSAIIVMLLIHAVLNGLGLGFWRLKRWLKR